MSNNHLHHRADQAVAALQKASSPAEKHAATREALGVRAELEKNLNDDAALALIRLAQRNPQNVIKADASEFLSYLGNAIITEEGSHSVYQIAWDNTNKTFTKTPIGTFPSQPEDGIFVTAAILNPGCTLTNSCGNGSSVPEPGTLALMGLGLASFGFSRQKRRSLG